MIDIPFVEHDLELVLGILAVIVVLACVQVREHISDTRQEHRHIDGRILAERAIQNAKDLGFVLEEANYATDRSDWSSFTLRMHDERFEYFLFVQQGGNRVRSTLKVPGGNVSWLVDEDVRATNPQELAEALHRARDARPSHSTLDPQYPDPPLRRQT